MCVVPRTAIRDRVHGILRDGHEPGLDTADKDEVTDQDVTLYSSPHGDQGRGGRFSAECKRTRVAVPVPERKPSTSR